MYNCLSMNQSNTAGIRNWRSCLLVMLLFLYGQGDVIGQDPVYSQFYNAHLQMNAAMAGNTRTPLLQLNYRNQWPGLGNIYTTYSISADKYISRLKSGVGCVLLTDNAGDGTLRSTMFTGFYSYRVRVTRERYLKAGLEAGYGNVALDWNKLRFGDALDPLTGPVTPGGTPLPSREVPFGDGSASFLNLGAGIVLYDPYWHVGISVKNINSPNLSFLTSDVAGLGSERALPPRFTLHAGSQYVFRGGNKNTFPSFVSPNILITAQGGYTQVNGGAYLSLNQFMAGSWYRYSTLNGDAVIVSAGFRTQFLKVTYSFDYTVSELSIRQGGSHEVGLVINFDHLYPGRQEYNDCFAIFR
jgi:type IX secretion system PorP/SprF family membrane protein